MINFTRLQNVNFWRQHCKVNGSGYSRSVSNSVPDRCVGNISMIESLQPLTPRQRQTMLWNHCSPHILQIPVIRRIEYVQTLFSPKTAITIESLKTTVQGFSSCIDYEKGTSMLDEKVTSVFLSICNTPSSDGFCIPVFTCRRTSNLTVTFTVQP